MKYVKIIWLLTNYVLYLQRMNNKSLVHQNHKFDALQSLEMANTFIQKLDDSQLLENFKSVNKDTGKLEIRKGDAISAIVMGAKLGLDPVTSLNVGKDLKGSSIFAIDKGISMGLSALESIKSIHAIPTKNGISLHTSIHIISKKIIESGTVIEILKDRAPVYSYYVKPENSNDFVSADTDRIEDEKGGIRDKFFLLDVTVTNEEKAEAKAANKLAITRYVSDFITTVKLTRKAINTSITISYKRSEAIQAGLLEVKDSKGNIIQSGKANWNNAEAQMMRNRAISTAGRIIAADYLNGVYDIASEIEHLDDKYTEANAEQI